MSEVKVIEVEKVKLVLRKYKEDMSDFTHDTDKNKLGKVLTVIDGAIADETQRKAVKDLIHDGWYNSMNHRIYPQMHHVAEVLGFQLYEDADTLPATPMVNYNPYKDLIK